MAKAKPRTGELVTANYGWTKPTVGASADVWGGYINADLDGIDSIVHGIQTGIPVVPSASATQPVMDGAATAGSSGQWARGDHVHPTDTSRASVASVPVASTMTPVMAGIAATGTGTTWARADHVHPTDTTRYAANNPNGYQTAAQVTATLAGYLPLTGGTLSGALTGTLATFSGGNVASRAAGGNAAFQCLNNTGTQVGSLYWSVSNSQFIMQNFSGSGGTIIIDASGNANTSGQVVAGSNFKSNIGYQCKAGTAGSFDANMFNIEWPSGAAHLWIDNTNQGAIAISSDYRIKKDVAPLASTWERVKALKPITYTQAEYHPAIATIRVDESGEPLPMFPADDIERWGFIAHELQETLIASAATGVKDQPDLVQSPNPWTVIATLTKALQEAMNRIEALEAAR